MIRIRYTYVTDNCNISKDDCLIYVDNDILYSLSIKFNCDSESAA